MHKPITAIVVDDDKVTLGAFCEYLEIAGVKVVGIGHDGNEAVELYQRKKPDIVFLDLIMPKYDGFYALENIRKADPAARIVVVTEDLRDDNERKLVRLNPNKIFFKPFDTEQIKNLLKELETPRLMKIQPDKYQNALVSFIIYETLKKISKSTLEEVGNRLYAKHGSYFSDCLEHPEYLRDILIEIFGKGYRSIIEKIEAELADVAGQRQIANFLVVLNG